VGKGGLRLKFSELRVYRNPDGIDEAGPAVRFVGGKAVSNPYFSSSRKTRGVIRKSENCSATDRNEARHVETTACPN
jgi:hypothetical protein